MKKVIASFSGRAYDATTKLTVERATQMGADQLMVFDDKWLMSTDYYKFNRWIFEATCRIQDEPQIWQHGFGWCSWKAFVVMTAWKSLHDGDVVLYLDADTYPVAPFGKIFDVCAAEGGVMVFEEKASNLRFTKADVGAAMGVPVVDGNMACGRFSLWQKGSFLAEQMLAEWWAYSINPRCTLWDRSVLVPDPPEYYRSSTEQSVLTQLAKKYGLTLHRGPDQWGVPVNGDTRDVDAYPGAIFHQQWCDGDRKNYSGSSYRTC